MFKGHCHCGQTSWTFSNEIESVTACNCTLCRRYGALWAYGYVGEGITTSGETEIYSYGKNVSNYHFCSKCKGLSHYIVNSKNAEGKTKMAVNLRMIDDVKKIENLPVDHFDGLDTFEDQPRDGRAVKDLWF